MSQINALWKRSEFCSCWCTANDLGINISLFRVATVEMWVGIASSTLIPHLHAVEDNSTAVFTKSVKTHF